MASTLKCPLCKLENPCSAERCDCGYEFGTRSKPPQRKEIRLWGSTAALVIGCLSLIGGISQVAAGNPASGDNAIGGFVMLLGALAFRSAKRRRFGIKADTWGRCGMEIALLAIVLVAIVLQSNWLDRLYLNPTVNVIIPLCVVMAYAVVVLKQWTPGDAKND